MPYVTQNFQPDPQSCTKLQTAIGQLLIDAGVTSPTYFCVLRPSPVESTFRYTIEYEVKAVACSIRVTGGTFRGYASRSAERKAGLIIKPTLVRIRASPSRLGVALGIIATGR
jgi:hypothetical protein